MWILEDWILGRFGADFQIALVPLQILLFSQLIAAAAGSQIFLMTMTGHERGAAMIVTLSAIGNALLSAVLINRFGIIGAAVASTVTLLALNLAMAAFVRRHLGLFPGILAFVANRRVARVS